MNEVRIISGLHRGISLPLDGDTIIVGSSLDADIALVDPGIAEKHIQIESSDKLPKNCWQLHIYDDETRREDGSKVSGSVTAKLNQKYNLGGVWVSFSTEDAPWPTTDIGFTEKKAKPVASLTNNKFLIKAYSVMAGILIGIVTLTHAGGDNNDTSAMKKTSYTPSTNNSDDASVEATTQPSRELLIIYKKMLRERQLRNVDVIEEGGAWHLSGLLSATELEKLKRMNRRFTKKYGNTIALVNNIEQLQETLPFSITKVISGPMAHIETDDGYILYEGNTYKDIKLVGINENTIMFSGKNNIEVKW